MTFKHAFYNAAQPSNKCNHLYIYYALNAINHGEGGAVKIPV